MTTQIVTASLQLHDGTTVDMYSSITDSATGLTTGELKTSANGTGTTQGYAIAATSLGTFANGKTIVAVTQPVTGATNVHFAYVERRGTIISILPCATRGVQSQPYMPWVPLTLAAGDTIQVCCAPAATKINSYSVLTNTGVQAIFGGVAASGNVELVHVISGQGIGASLTGQQIVRHMGTQNASSAALNISSGVYIISDRGLPVGNCPLTVTANTPQRANALGGAMINLNFIARVTNSA